MAKKNRDFVESAYKNKQAYLKYFQRLWELGMSMFEWVNLPDTVDERFLELTLFTKGAAIFFKDEDLGYLCLPAKLGGKFSVYNVPTRRTAYASNGYNMPLTPENSVVIYNNLIRTPSTLMVEDYAAQLYDIERSIITNAKAQKTPMLISCEESQKLSLENLYMKYEGNVPVIYGYKNLSPDAIKAISTGAPYVADKLYQLKTAIWNEALTYLGISNINYQKKERLISDEVVRNMGGTIASRFSRMNPRKDACNLINEMFGLDIDVKFREDFREMDDEFMIEDTEEGKTANEMVVDLRTRSGFKVSDDE